MLGLYLKDLTYGLLGNKFIEGFCLLRQKVRSCRTYSYAYLVVDSESVLVYAVNVAFKR